MHLARPHHGTIECRCRDLENFIDHLDRPLPSLELVEVVDERLRDHEDLVGSVHCQLRELREELLRLGDAAPGALPFQDELRCELDVREATTHEGVGTLRVEFAELREPGTGRTRTGRIDQLPEQQEPLLTRKQVQHLRPRKKIRDHELPELGVAREREQDVAVADLLGQQLRPTPVLTAFVHPLQHRRDRRPAIGLASPFTLEFVQDVLLGELVRVGEGVEDLVMRVAREHRVPPLTQYPALSAGRKWVC